MFGLGLVGSSKVLRSTDTDFREYIYCKTLNKTHNCN